MCKSLLAVLVLLPAVAAAAELDLLPLGAAELAHELGSAAAGTVVDTGSGELVELDELARRLAAADVVLLGEEHTAMDQKLLHARIVDAIAATGRPTVLAMEFFQRGDRDALEAWRRGETDDRGLLEATAWYERGSYRWEYYRPVMEAARRRGLPIVGVNVPREIPRAVNRGGLEGLSEEQRREVGEVATDGSPEHRYLISRYLGDTVAALPPGWFDNMYAAQCLWDVVMARSLLAEVADGTTVVLIVGSGHVAYGLGIERRLAAERASAGLPPLAVATLCPVTAPAPEPDGEPTGHPMGDGGHGMGAAAGPPAQFVRSLADFVAVFEDNGGIEAYPTLGLRLAVGDDGRPMVSAVWPDTMAEDVGFASGDVILDVNGRRPADLGELRFMLAEIEWGQRLGLLVERGDGTLEVAALLFPTVDTTEASTAPGYAVEAVGELDPASPTVAPQLVLPDDRAERRLVSEDGAPVRIEIFRGEVLDEVHELDGDGRVHRSLLRRARNDGAVELRYERGADGLVVGVTGVDRRGGQVSP
jgi:uncharacterized iron-regulated protein